MAKFAILLMTASALLPAQVLLDTDSGTFSDDGVALTMLARGPRRIDLQAITVVAGNVWPHSGAGYMRRNAKLLGLNPSIVHVGAQLPLVHSVAMTKKEGPLEFAGALGTPVEPFDPSTAVDTIARTIERYPGKLTILAIGPLTNIAILLRQRPDLETKIASIVIMGGNVHVGGNASKAAEFNYWFDPEAAAIVMRSAIPNKVLFALDVCNKVKLTRDRFEKVIAVKTPITDLYREDFGERYPGFLKNPNAEGSLWDELAAAYVLEPSVVTESESLWLDVETTFGPRYGAITMLDLTLAPDATPVKVVLDMNFERVFEIYTNALTVRKPGV